MEPSGVGRVMDKEWSPCLKALNKANNVYLSIPNKPAPLGGLGADVFKIYFGILRHLCGKFLGWT